MSRTRRVQVGPGDIGHRIVLRHLLPDGRATDVLGELLEWDTSGVPGRAVVRTRAGEVTVPLEAVLLGKRVPPAPEPRVRRRPPGSAGDLTNAVVGGELSVSELEAIMAEGWRPLEQASYGGWRLRAAQGFTGRANSVLPLGDPPEPLAAAVDYVERWYAERGLPGRFAVPWPLEDPGGAGSALDGELARRGYRLDTPTLVLTADLATVTEACAPSAALLAESRISAAETAARPAFGERGPRVVVAGQPDEGWLSLYRYRGQELPPVATQVLTSAKRQAFACVREGERVVAVGRAAIDDGWAGITAVEVAADRRRRGLGTVILGALGAWAQGLGAHSSYLQVARANEPGRALYGGLGYAAHHGYHYRIQP